MAAATALALSIQAGPLGQERSQERALRHDTAAIVKLITVRVLGPDGRPMAGLKKEDFTLTDDGRPQKITEFEVHAMTEAGMATTPEVPLPKEAAGRAAEATNRKLFFFLDQQASDRAGKDKAKAVALDFLDKHVRPGDQVAVIGWYAMSGFYIREYLTKDLARIRKAIDGVTEAPPSPSEPVGLPADDVDRGAEEAGAERHVETLLAERSAAVVSNPLGGSGGGVVMAPGTAAFQRTDFVPRLAEIAEIFKTIPGPKSLILFTARDMGSEADRLGKLFGAAGTAVYAVNTQDWKMGPFGTKHKYIWTEHSLKDMSAASGGEYFADINAAAAIARDVQDLTGNYYVIGYYVQDSWDGKFHEIRVEVARPDARVLVQDGFADSKPFDRMSDFEKDVQLLDLLWSDQPSSAHIPLIIDPLVVRRGDASQGCFLSRWEIGAETGPPAAPVEVFALLRDATGAALVSRKWDVDLTSYAGRTVLAYLTNPLGTGPYEMRLVVRNRLTGDSCVGQSRFSAAAPLEEGILLGSPLLFEAGPAASFLRLPTRPLKVLSGKSVADGPSLQGLYRLIPKEGSPVVDETSPGTRRVIAVIPIEIKPFLADDTPILSVEAKFISLLDGRETPLEVKIRDHLEQEGNPDILAVDIFFGDIPPGRYDLVIAVEDMGTDRRAVCRKPVTVR